MKKTLLSGLIMAAFAAPAFAQETAEDPATRYPGYKLEFAQEFDDPTMDLHDVFNFEKGFKRNNEHQVYMDRPENAFIDEEGHLVIRALDKITKNPYYDKFAGNEFKGQKKEKLVYTSASLQSHWRGHYGIWETRAKLPIGDGYWPAIWGTGNTRGWPGAGELDIMEYYGDAIHANLCWGSGGGTWSSKAPRMSEFDPKFADEFHIWRCEWDHNSCRIYLDDRLLNETDLDRTVNSDGYNPYRDANNGFQVWLNLALGGNNGGNPANAKYPADYIIDYARVYVPESADATLHYFADKAQKLLDSTKEGDGPMEYSAAARQALSDAIETCKGVFGSTDDNVIDAAQDAIRAAISKYEGAANAPLRVNEEFSLEHVASGCLLSNGWHKDVKQVLLLNSTEKGYNQAFKLVATPANAEAKGYNIMTVEGDYLYRNSWNLFYTDDKSKLNTKDYIFNVEIQQGNIVIKNEGSGKYFGSDETEAWAHLYSDKPGAYNTKAYFKLYEWPTGINDVTVNEDNGVKAVYNLQGLYVGETLDAVRAGQGQIYIVVEGNTTRKVIR